MGPSNHTDTKGRQSIHRTVDFALSKGTSPCIEQSPTVSQKILCCLEKQAGGLKQSPFISEGTANHWLGYPKTTPAGMSSNGAYRDLFCPIPGEHLRTVEF